MTAILRGRADAQLSVFVSTSAGEEHEAVRQALGSLGHRLVEPELEPGVDFVDALQRSMSKADVVVAVLGDRDESRWTPVEIGYALDAGKPVIALGDFFHPVLRRPGIRTVSASLRDRHALATELAFHLEHLGRSPSNRPLGFPSRADAVGAHSDTEVERRAVEVLSSSFEIARVVRPPREREGGGYAPDIAFWFNADDRGLGLVLVEVKPDMRNIDPAIERLAEYAKIGHVEDLMVLTGAPGTRRIELVRSQPNVYLTSLDALRVAVRANELASSILEARNGLVHHGP